MDFPLAPLTPVVSIRGGTGLTFGAWCRRWTERMAFVLAVPVALALTDLIVRGLGIR